MIWIQIKIPTNTHKKLGRQKEYVGELFSDKQHIEANNNSENGPLIIKIEARSLIRRLENKQSAMIGWNRCRGFKTDRR